MSRVRFFELRRNPKLDELERKVRQKLRAQDLKGVAVRLFQDGEERIGYSTQIVATVGGKKILDRVHQIVCEAIGFKRGRPPEEPTHQVKCRIPESAYRALVRESKRRKTTPSTLLREWVVKHVG